VTSPDLVLIQKFFRLPRHDRRLLFEAVFWLAFAWLAIALLPFSHVGRLAGRPVRTVEPRQRMRLLAIERIRWAVVASARRVPWRANCFQQGLATQFMLRRRGVPAVLYYGAAMNPQEGLSAHVWVRHGDIDVVGCETASRFAVLAAFPPQEGSSSGKRWLSRDGES
jgi:hypothetical protein